jgi:hypothetical protein
MVGALIGAGIQAASRVGAAFGFVDVAPVASSTSATNPKTTPSYLLGAQAAAEVQRRSASNPTLGNAVSALAAKGYEPAVVAGPVVVMNNTQNVPAATVQQQVVPAINAARQDPVAGEIFRQFPQLSNAPSMLVVAKTTSSETNKGLTTAVGFDENGTSGGSVQADVTVNPRLAAGSSVNSVDLRDPAKQLSGIYRVLGNSQQKSGLADLVGV